MAETTIIETVLVTIQTGKTAVFDVTQSVCPHTWTRAYIRGSTRYYEMEVFERGLASEKVKKVERISIFDLPYEADIDEQGCLIDAACVCDPTCANMGPDGCAGLCEYCDQMAAKRDS